MNTKETLYEVVDNFGNCHKVDTWNGCIAFIQEPSQQFYEFTTENIVEIEQEEEEEQIIEGLYYNGELKADTYFDAIKELYQLKTIPKGFCINEDHEANGYSIIDKFGVQHIYELYPDEFYDQLMRLK